MHIIFFIEYDDGYKMSIPHCMQNTLEFIHIPEERMHQFCWINFFDYFFTLATEMTGQMMTNGIGILMKKTWKLKNGHCLIFGAVRI